MTLKGSLFILLFTLLTAAACRQAPELPPTAPPTAVAVSPTGEPPTNDSSPPTLDGETRLQTPPVLISEVLPGVEGGNNHEFIELYNPGVDAVDLDRWSLWYLTREEQEETLVYSWNQSVDLPGLGHFLLVHEGEEIGVLPDAVYNTALFEGKGGLVLRNADGDVVDRTGWGDAPSGYYEGTPITDFEKGNSLERLPGGELGNGNYSGDNAADLIARNEPDPQNSGSWPTPADSNQLIVTLISPEDLPPGQDFDLVIEVENPGQDVATDVVVSLPVAAYFTAVALPDNAQVSDGQVNWTIDRIEAGNSSSSTLTLTTPFANIDTLMTGYYAEAAGQPRSYGALQILEMGGSAIPVSVARSLPEGSNVTVEGVVTMYPGGFFAGSSSAKFYLEDETGGVQIFVDGGRFEVPVKLGDRVRATGLTTVFRDTLEVVPQDNAADIEVLESGGSSPEPAEITIIENESLDDVLGRLNRVAGTATRIEEFSYHYEIDLEDDAGNQTLILAEKDTGFSTDDLHLGSLYQVTGISELVSGIRQLKPRLPSDIEEVFPPILLLEASGPTNILPGETMTMTITAVNHTAELLTNVVISAESPGGSQQWTVPTLEGEGGRVSVTYLVPVAEEAAGILDTGTLSVVSDQWTDPAVAEPLETYIGRGVPIWAIQGDGLRSPLIGERVTAIGVVTGVFPDMDGFFLQSIEPDGDPTTSDGIFVDTGILSQRVDPGNLIAVNGRVREDSGQTILRPPLPDDIVVEVEEDVATVEPVVYDPPQDSAEAEVYKESLEGMLVAINESATVVGPTNQYGESVLLYEKWGTDLLRRSDGPQGYLMWIDDGTFNRHEDQTTLPLAVARGDTVTNVVGPLAYTFSNYKIAPLLTPDIQTAERPLGSIPEAADNQFSIATFNVENLFDTRIPHPQSPPRPTNKEYQLHLQKVAESIVALGAPTLIALQEVENMDVLQDLAGQPQLATYDYQAALVEGQDSRGIDVGYLVRGDRATIDDFAVRDAPNELFSRPPLMLVSTVHLDSGDQQVVLLNNHFLSLSAGEVQTEPVRNNQAAWNASLVGEIKDAYPEAHVVVLGDLNSFYQTKPIETLQQSGLRHAYEFYADGEDLPYTYIFEGLSQTLDHILMSEGLFNNLALVDFLPVGADYPLALPNDPSPRRVSDHNPLVAVFTFE